MGGDTILNTLYTYAVYKFTHKCWNHSKMKQMGRQGRQTLTERQIDRHTGIQTNKTEMYQEKGEYQIRKVYFVDAQEKEGPPEGN